MKIISQKSGWVGQVKCEHCETVMEVEQEEILYGRFYSGMDAEESMEYYVKCPVCGENVFFDQRKMPGWVKVLIANKHKDKNH